MTWTWERSTVIGLAKASCSTCHGWGLCSGRNRGEVPCLCVFRRIFRICWRRYEECAALAPHVNAVTWERCGGRGFRAYSRPREEYMADCCLVARRVLPPCLYAIFQAHYERGLDWHACCKLLHMGRGLFFHHVYSLEELLGRAFAELRPYALYPVSEYFAGAESAAARRRFHVSDYVEREPEPLPEIRGLFRRAHAA